jgi:hypothetical protein
MNILPTLFWLFWGEAWHVRTGITGHKRLGGVVVQDGVVVQGGLVVVGSWQTSSLRKALTAVANKTSSVNLSILRFCHFSI